MLFVWACGGAGGSELDGGDDAPDATTACPPGAIFTVAPVELDTVTSIVGMGWFASPGHIIPSDHGGMFLTGTAIPFRAAGDFVIVALRRTTYVVSPNRQGERDYAITYRSCGGEGGTFGHVASLTPELEAAITAPSCSMYTTIDETIESCTTQVQLQVAAGDLLGGVGGATAMVFDWGHLDENVTNYFVNPSRYAPATLHATCPYDRFEPALRDALLARMQRTAEPRCGEMELDVAGTAQGVWVDAANPVNQGGDERPFVTLGPQYDAPATLLRLALGPEALGGRERDVAREATGRKNRPFADVAADGQLHCYVTQGSPTESHLLALEPTGELRIELVAHAGGASPCDADPSSWAFTGAAMTFIR